MELSSYLSTLTYILQLVYLTDIKKYHKKWYF